MQYQVEENCLTIFLPKEVDHHNAEEIRKEADQVIAKKHIKHVIFDFSSTNFMDSSGIGVLIGRKKTMDMHRGEICARNLGERAQKIFDKSGLTQIILVESGREEKQ